MAWTDISQYVIDDIFGFQDANQIVDNFNYLFVGGAGQGKITTTWLANSTVTLAKVAYGVKIKTGTYAGDGGATKAITGVGFTSRLVIIVSDEVAASIWFKTDQMGATQSIEMSSGGTLSATNRIKAIGGDGFTVDDQSADGGPNKTGENYFYMCWG